MRLGRILYRALLGTYIANDGPGLSRATTHPPVESSSFRSAYLRHRKPDAALNLILIRREYPEYMPREPVIERLGISTLVIHTSSITYSTFMCVHQR